MESHFYLKNDIFSLFMLWKSPFSSNFSVKNLNYGDFFVSFLLDLIFVLKKAIPHENRTIFMPKIAICTSKYPNLKNSGKLDEFHHTESGYNFVNINSIGENEVPTKSQCHIDRKET